MISARKSTPIKEEEKQMEQEELGKRVRESVRSFMNQGFN